MMTRRNRLLRGSPVPCVRAALVAIALAARSAAQTALDPGDLAIIQYRAGKGDGFSFVALTDMRPRTTVLFTDKGWSGTGLIRSENVWPWVAPPAGVRRGEVVEVRVGSGLGRDQGDQIIALQGSLRSPRFICAISTSPWLTTGAIDRTTSFLPAGLVNGDTARDFPAPFVQGSFNIARVAGTPDKIRSTIGERAHWHCSSDAPASARRASARTFAVADPVRPPLLIGVGRSTTPLIRMDPLAFGFLCGAADDPADPASSRGIDFVVAGADPARIAVSANCAPETGKRYAPPFLYLARNEASWTLRIEPSGSGYARITVSATNGPWGDAYEFLYASTTWRAVPDNTRHHTRSSDASAVVSAGPLHMLVGDDEDQVIRLYHRYESGAPLAEFDMTPHLNLTDQDSAVPREVDIEGAAEVGRRVYWIGSHGNSRSGRERLNRGRVFSTDRSGSGAGTTLSYVGRYEGLREDLLAWDARNGHGLGSNHLGLVASSYAADEDGIEPKRPDGFNIEGLAMMPGSTCGAYIGFRAPLVPPGDRRLALLVPVSNFAAIVDTSSPPGSARLGAPILLDLDGRGVRSLARHDSNDYLIVAGPPAASARPSEDFGFYLWSGVPGERPRRCEADLASAGLEGDIEGVIEEPGRREGGVHVVLDCGARDWYGDGTPSKWHVSGLQQFVSGRLAVTEAPGAQAAGRDSGAEASSAVAASSSSM